MQIHELFSCHFISPHLTTPTAVPVYVCPMSRCVHSKELYLYIVYTHVPSCTRYIQCTMYYVHSTRYDIYVNECANECACTCVCARGVRAGECVRACGRMRACVSTWERMRPGRKHLTKMKAHAAHVHVCVPARAHVLLVHPERYEERHRERAYTYIVRCT